MSVIFSVVGTIGITSIYLWLLQLPPARHETIMSLSCGHPAFKIVWVFIWAAAGAMMALGSRMFYDAAGCIP